MKRTLLLLVLSLGLMAGCNSSAVKDALDSLDEVPRKDIDTTRLGVNAFVNDSRFGTARQQFNEVHDTLRLNFVRILLNWDDNVQPTPSATPNFNFYDDVIAALPPGVDALVVVTGLPSWMANSGNWTDGNPRTTFVERWVRRVVSRYGRRGAVIGFEIWNEPNMRDNSENVTLGIAESADNYVEMLARAFNVVRELAPGKLVLNAATTAINQNFSETLDYNRAMRDAGAQNFLDKWAIHYYGKQFENVRRSGGVSDFLNGLSKGVWVTESGAQGVNHQLAYGEQVWPFLREEIPGIERIYAYQFTEASPSDVTYGMRTLDPAFPVSDLYIALRDRS